MTFELEVRISDTGIGMTPEQVSKIFDPFVQADTSVTRKFGGTGLGLSISKRIVEALGGEISVTSEPGAGTELSFMIQIGDCKETERISAAEDAKRHAASAKTGKQENLTDLNGGTILLVDDGDANRKLINLILSKAGCVITEASNGKIGSDLALEYEFDLREHGYTAPIMALTANAMTSDRELCEEAGCTDFLAKPVDIDQLLETVAKYITPKPHAKESSSSEVIEANLSISSMKSIADLGESLLGKNPTAPASPSAAIDVEIVSEPVHVPTDSQVVSPSDSDVGFIEDDYTIELGDFEYFFAEYLGAIENSIEAKEFDKLPNLAKFIQYEASKRSIASLAKASEALISSCEAEPLVLEDVTREISNLSRFGDELFNGNVGTDSIIADYSKASRKRVAHIQRGWEIKNFRLMRLAFEKLQCDSYVTGRSAVGDALVDLIKCCDDRDNVSLNLKLTPFLKTIRSEMTATGLHDSADFQQEQEKLAGKLRTNATSVNLDQAQPNIRIEVKTDSANVVDPIYSTLPADEDFREIILDFIPQVEVKLREMELAIKEAQFTELAELAHWLKGAGGTCGFNDLYAPSFEMEQAAKAKDKEACVMCLDLLISLAQRIVVQKIPNR